MNYLLLDPRPQTRADMLALLQQHAPVLGIEVTEPELGMRNPHVMSIDPQHDGSAPNHAAIEMVAGYVEELADFQAIAILRPDADAVGAAAVLWLYQSGIRRTDAINRRIGQIADGDAMRNLDRPDWVWHALNQWCLTSRAPLAEKVQAMADWLVSGTLPSGYDALYARLIDEVRQAEAAIRVRDGIAVAETTARAVTWIGFQFAPIVVASNPACTLMSDTPYRKHTVAVRPDRPDLLARMPGVLAALRQIEPGWGGNVTGGVIGSPQGVGSKLELDAIVALVMEVKER